MMYIHFNKKPVNLKIYRRYFGVNNTQYALKVIAKLNIQFVKITNNSSYNKDNHHYKEPYNSMIMKVLFLYIRYRSYIIYYILS